jgi:hypothetical protein
MVLIVFAGAINLSMMAKLNFPMLTPLKTAS